MKVAGFTFIRNAVKLDFPVFEAIKSVLPVCDAFYVALGQSDDDTRNLIETIDPEKISIIDTVWDSNLQKGGVVYADETNKAFDAIPSEYDWCFYIQGDEVVHEKDLCKIMKAMERFLPERKVEGLLFGYRHFYGTYDYIAVSRKWYRNEVRIIRNDKTIRSHRDAQGFRRKGKKLWVARVDADVYHYGWVRSPRFMQKKIDEVSNYYIGESTIQSRKKIDQAVFDYECNYDLLERFTGTHPMIMNRRINHLNWQIEVDLNIKKLKFRYRLLHWFEKLTGIRLFEFRNYRLIKGLK